MRKLPGRAALTALGFALAGPTLAGSRIGGWKSRSTRATELVARNEAPLGSPSSPRFLPQEDMTYGEEKPRR